MTWEEFKNIDPENIETNMHTFFILSIHKYYIKKDDKIHIFVRIKDWIDRGIKDNDYVVAEKYFVTDIKDEYSELLTKVREYLVDYTIERFPMFELEDRRDLLYNIYLLNDWVKYNPADNSISEVDNGQLDK